MANLGSKAARTTIHLAADVLGTSGEYRVSRIDAKTGAATPHGTDSESLKTSLLPPWGLEGFKLSR